MDITPQIERVQDDLRAAAAVGGAEFAERAEHLTVALDASLRLALLDAISAAANELTVEIAPSSVAMRVDAGMPRLEAFLDVAPAGDSTAGATSLPLAAPEDADESDAEVARFSLRISYGLKRQIETVAHREQVSTNTWIARTLAGAVAHDVPRPETTTRSRGRMRGWAH